MSLYPFQELLQTYLLKHCGLLRPTKMFRMPMKAERTSKLRISKVNCSSALICHMFPFIICSRCSTVAAKPSVEKTIVSITRQGASVCASLISAFIALTPQEWWVKMACVVGVFCLGSVAVGAGRIIRKCRALFAPDLAQVPGITWRRPRRTSAERYLPLTWHKHLGLLRVGLEGYKCNSRCRVCPAHLDLTEPQKWVNISVLQIATFHMSNLNKNWSVIPLASPVTLGSIPLSEIDNETAIHNYDLNFSSKRTQCCCIKVPDASLQFLNLFRDAHVHVGLFKSNNHDDFSHPT
jgi:hypothetical protein